MINRDKAKLMTNIEQSEKYIELEELIISWSEDIEKGCAPKGSAEYRSIQDSINEASRDMVFLQRLMDTQNI